MKEDKKNTKLSHEPCVYVYVRKIPFDIDDNNLSIEERAREIDLCGSEKVRDQKFYAWKLLELAMTEVFGLDMSDAGMKKEESIWCCDKCHFSISHSEDCVAVAVSTHPVGVDVEEYIDGKFDKVKDLILHKEEQKTFKDINYCAIWTQKEAIFKKSRFRRFVPNRINTIGEKFFQKKLEIGDKTFALCIATDLDVDVQYNTEY